MSVRVLVVSHLYPSELEPLRGPFVAQQVHALRSHADVDVVSGVYGGEDRAALYEGVPVEYVRLPWARGLPSKVAVALAAAPYARKTMRHVRRTGRRPDIVHAHYGFPDGVVGSAVAARLGVPCVVTLHGDDANLQLRLPVAGRVMAAALASADAVVCVSETMRNEVRDRHPALGEKAVAVPNGYDTRDIGYEPKPAPEYFLFVGALLPVKDPEILLRAYAAVACGTGLDLAVVGEGPLEERLRSLASELGIAARVRFLGTLPHAGIAGALRLAQALVLPSRHEGMPMVVVEALATGTPVIASAVGGIPELVGDEQLGLLVPPGDETALAAALSLASRRKWDPEEVAHRAPVISWEENALRLTWLYERCMRARGPAARAAVAGESRG